MIGMRIRVLQSWRRGRRAREFGAVGDRVQVHRMAGPADTPPFMKVPRVAKRDPPAKPRVGRGTLKLKMVGAVAMGRRRLRTSGPRALASTNPNGRNSAQARTQPLAPNACAR